MKRINVLIGLIALGLVVGLVGCTEPSVPVPNSPENYCNEGWEYLMINDIRSAQFSFNRALDINPGYANAWNGLGWAALSNESYESAFIRFSYGKQTVGDPEDQLTKPYRNLFFRFFMDAYVGSGLVHYMEGRYHMAIEDIERALDYEHNKNYEGDEGGWHYFNWYTRHGDSYTLSTWQAHLYAALSYLKNKYLDMPDRFAGANHHINMCRVRNGQSGDFNGTSLPTINAEINRLFNITPPAPEEFSDGYPEGYPNY